MLSKKQTIILVIGIVVIIIAQSYLARPMEKEIWKPSGGNYEINATLQGEPDRFSFSDQTVTSDDIERETGLAGLSFEAFQRKFGSLDENIKIEARWDGQVLYAQEKQGYFTLVDVSPSPYRGLQVKSLKTDGKKAALEYGVKPDIFFIILAAEVMIWIAIVFIGAVVTLKDSEMTER